MKHADSAIDLTRNINDTMAVARELQLVYRRCSRVLDFAHEFADGRWSNAGQCFLNVQDPDEDDLESKHLVNNVTALAIISKQNSPFNQSQLRAFDKMKLAAIVEYAIKTSTAGKDKSRTMGDDPEGIYARAWELLALGRFLADVREEQGPVDKVELEQFGRLIVTWRTLLTDYLAKWPTVAEDKARPIDHIYFAYMAMQAMEASGAISDKWATITDKTAYETARRAVVDRVALQYFQQLSYCLADVPQYLDSTELALSLLILLEHGGGQYDIPDLILEKALDAVFSLQRPTGFWDDCERPLLSQAGGGGVGCSSVQIASAFLENARCRARLDRFLPGFLGLLKSLLDEGERFASVNPAVGWSTDVRRPRRAAARQTWYGFLVLEFIALMGEATREMASRDLLGEFRLREGKPRQPLARLKDFCDYKKALEEQFIRPWKQVDESNRTSERERLRKRVYCSAILFGPPGTGKTSIAHAVAGELNWPLYEIGPGDFLRHGMDGVFRQGDEVFRRLLLAKRTVVLFDEMDEMVRLRNDDAESFSRFLTTYMLPWLQRLRDQQELIFFFATNSIRQFDPAVKRDGRIDLVLPIGPPEPSGKLEYLEEQLKEAKADLTDDNRGLLESELGTMPQATIGDLRRAMAESIIGAGAGRSTFDPRKFVSLLSPGRLLIDPKEWNEFLDTCQPYRPKARLDELRVDLKTGRTAVMAGG